MSKFNLIFPMAGESSRFNYQFKPFLQISDQTFIELAYLHFKKHENKIHRLYFIITKEQYDTININEKLSSLFCYFQLIVLPEKTSGPYLTIQAALQTNKIDTNLPCFICDCDHSINIDPMISFINENDNFDIVIPVWDITTENSSDWGIVYLNEKNKVVDFSEKKIIHKDYIHKGIIGCYYFQNLKYFLSYDYNNISEGLKDYFKNIQTVPIKEAEFFGDMKRLEKTIQMRKNISTIFCDIDGTLAIHDKEPDNLSLNIIDGSLEKLKEWNKQGYTIILTTSRTKEYELRNLLKHYSVPYDQLICGLPSGSRILINDVKLDVKPTAYSINILRNHGIHDCMIKDEDIKVLNVLKGNSFSKTIVVQGEKGFFVRKYILKKEETQRHYHKLKRQYYDLQRMNSYSKNICPNVMNEVEEDYIYWYDLDYLENYRQLTLKDENPLFNLLDRLNRDIYSTKKVNSNNNWINDYFENKIKIATYQSLDPLLHTLFNLDTIIINDKEYIGYHKIFERIDLNKYNPMYLSVIHGDLTFENIMYNENLNDIKLIDLDGSDFLDAIELDLGKLLQSYLSRYESWIQDPDNLIHDLDLDNHIINTRELHGSVNNEFYQLWSSILNESDIDTIKNKGIFFMCSHLLRALPYLFQKDIRLCIYCVKEIILWLNSII